MSGIQIGQILVEQNVLTEEQVEHILNVQAVSYRPFGDLAERLFGVSPKAVEDAWVQQYVEMTGIVDLDQLEIDSQCLRAINRRQAWQFQILPATQDLGGLNIATDRDHLARALNFTSHRLPGRVSFLVAERRQLREFLMRHYPVPQHMAEFAERF